MSSRPISSRMPSFRSRLNRVAEARAPYEAERPEVSVLPDWKQHFRLPMAIFAAMIVGALAVLAVRYARLQYMGGGFAGQNPDVTMAIDVGAAFAIAFILFALARKSGLLLAAGHLVGVFAMIGFMHNVAHTAPQLFASIYSAPWTTEIASASEPGSLYFRGGYITVMQEAEEVIEVEEPEETEIALPRVIRLQ